MTPQESVLLLVEDDVADAKLIQRALAKVEMPAKIVHVMDGDKAVEYFQGEGTFADRKAYPLPWLVLLDVKLPRRSGVEVLQWLRDQQREFASTPVVMLSSSSHGVDINTAYHYGANSYLVKPETTHQLESMMSLIKSYWFMHNQMPRTRGTAT
jgi:CheY-like chemotaxis protein